MGSEPDDGGAGAGGAAGGAGRGGATGGAGRGGATGTAGSGGFTPTGEAGRGGGPGGTGAGGAAGQGGRGGAASPGGRGGAAGSAAAGGAGGGAVCVYGGVSHPVGSSFLDVDGCNNCTCTTSGIACTARACPPDAGSDGAVDGGDGGVCVYGGVSHPVGSSFPSTDGCNTCSCGASGVGCTKIACPPMDGGAACALAASYSYGETGGFVAYRDQAVLGPTTYRYSRIPTGPTAEPITCAPALPACDTANAIDIADIKVDLADPDVKTALNMKTPPLYGRDMRPVDQTIFELTASTGGGFLVGSACPASASSCIGIPSGIAKLVADLHALDEQQLKDQACKGLRN